MKRIVLLVISLGVLGLAMFIPALSWANNSVEAATAVSSGDSSDPTTITDYKADFDLADDGDLSVVETLTVSFPSFPERHGIFRFWDRVDNSAEHARRIVQDVEVTLDGKDVDNEMSVKDGRFDVAKIGSANVIVAPGEHVYEITYVIPGVLEPGTDGEESQFYWQLIPAGWAQDIERSELTVHLPAAGQHVQCGVGIGADPTPCTLKGDGTEEVSVTTGPIAHNTPVTFKAGLDIPTPPPGKEVPWSGRFDPVLGQSPMALGAVALVGLGAAGGGVALSRRARERQPQFPVMYAPPDGIGPAQGAYILTESTDRTAYVATLLHVAEHGAIDLQKNGDAWTISDKGGPTGWSGLDPVSTSVAHLLGGPGSSFTADPKGVKAGERLKTEISAFDTTVKDWAKSSGNLVPIPFGGMFGLLTLGGLAAAIAIAIWNPLNMTMMALIPGLFFIFGAPLLVTGATTKRTSQGRDIWSRMGGFRRILSTPSSQDRFDFSGREELYTAYVPWAVALGCADEWAAKYQTEMGHEPPSPSYFGGAYLGSSIGSSVGSMVADFDSTVDSAISSYDATQTSSSSGGGGFSGGGGGGGGGGGSW